MSKVTFVLYDNNLEKASFGVDLPSLNAISYVATKALVDDLQTALADISLGVLGSRTVTDSVETYEVTRSIDPACNREAGVVFYMTSGTTSQKMRVTLPAPDLTKFPFATLGVGSVTAPFTGLHADLSAFITAIENAAVYTQDDGGVETVAVYKIEHVGRNL